MNISLGELLALVDDLLAIAGLDGLRDSSSQLIERMAKEAQRNRERRGEKRKSTGAEGDGKGKVHPRPSTCGQYRDGGRRGGAPRVTVTVRPR